MNLITAISLALGAVRSIAGNTILAKQLGVEKYAAVVDSLLGTASVLIEQGDAAVDDLKAFTAKVKDLKSRVDAGETIPESELNALKTESDDLHERLQALKGSGVNVQGKVAAGEVKPPPGTPARG